MTIKPPPLSSHKPKVVFGSDHAGFDLKELLKTKAEEWGYTVVDHGSFSKEPVDYPDYITPVVLEVLAGARGVLICGTGIGMSIGANRFRGIHAALCCDEVMAKFSRSHNDANILVLGARLISTPTAVSSLKAFLTTPFEGDRHLRRLTKLDSFSPPFCEEGNKP